MIFFFILSIGGRKKYCSIDYRVILRIYFLWMIQDIPVDRVAATKVIR
jgi:hypothetical protein